MEQREIFFSGMVQGVGFRYTTQRIAARYHVTGYVENLSDGRVHLVVEGDPQEIDRFVSEIYQHLGGFIRSADVNRGPATQKFQRFSIRYGTM
ncbi:acylphosphatase [Thermogutta sp.]|jgi:acylphosphatase|uniref:acylphosphatase n=1 Tax=Thermogutta sp. TaxID=1962930 RepID=UPI00322016B3